jgi:hypothetical protein
MTAHHLDLYPQVKEVNESATIESKRSKDSMNETQAPTKNPYQPGYCEIRLMGHLDDRWANWFGGLVLSMEEDGQTPLSGPVVDQAELFAMLRKVRDLGLPLLSVNLVESGLAENQE